MAAIEIADGITAIGASDRQQKLFEAHLPLKSGASYNSYLVAGERTAVLDGVDARVEEEYFANLAAALGGRKLDYIIVQHLEPDHSAAIEKLAELYPEATVIGNAKTASIGEGFFAAAKNMRLVADGEQLDLGGKVLKFVFTPMVHWPESMTSVELTSGTLFSQDAFGSFGAVEGSPVVSALPDGYADEMRRYYANIVGKYGAQVAPVLKKIAPLGIKTVCPLHGLCLAGGAIDEALALYDKWSAYVPETRSVAVIAASMYGSVMRAARFVARCAEEKGATVSVFDAAETDTSELLSQVWKCSHIVLASATHNGAPMPGIEQLLTRMKEMGAKNRKFSLIEGGSWAPAAARQMSAALAEMKDMTQAGETLAVKGARFDEEKAAALGEAIAADLRG